MDYNGTVCIGLVCDGKDEPMNAKELLLKLLHDCYVGDDEMSLQASLADLTAEEASWRMNDTTWEVELVLAEMGLS